MQASNVLDPNPRECTSRKFRPKMGLSLAPLGSDTGATKNVFLARPEDKANNAINSNTQDC